MIKFSANLGFLWTEHALPEAIRAAKVAGFDAVECHWPYATPAASVVEALEETGLSMLGLNTNRGDFTNGENGVAALVGREAQAKQFIDEAIDYATEVNCKKIHVMAGFANSEDKKAQETFTQNLRYACQAAAPHNKTILIEPLNHYDAPGYHISTLDEALAAVERVGEPNLKIMFDCYHMQIMGGDLLRRYKQAYDKIGHIQFASVPDRAEPDTGEINYHWLLHELKAVGYSGAFGAEYKPRTTTDEGLGWLSTLILDARKLVI